MKILVGKVNNIGDLDRLDPDDLAGESGLVVLVNREQLKNKGDGFLYEKVAIVPLFNPENAFTELVLLLAENTELKKEMRRMQNEYLESVHDMSVRHEVELKTDWKSAVKELPQAERVVLVVRDNGAYDVGFVENRVWYTRAGKNAGESTYWTELPNKPGAEGGAE